MLPTPLHFDALDRFLSDHAGLWRPRPFTATVLPWEATWPELSAALRRRSLADADIAGAALAGLDLPAPWPELSSQSDALSTLPRLPQTALPLRPRGLDVNVPGRKWTQINAFAAALRFRREPSHWLDWCAGKGHLGRLLACSGGTLTAFEIEAALVAEGERLSRRADITAAHRQCDVMTPAAHLQPGQTAVALHACGDLHTRLIRLVVDSGCRQLALAPCCYNRIAATAYEPLSTQARAARLQLDRTDLGLPLTETVTAGARERRQRDQGRAWRLAFDLLQREVRGVDSYLPTPSLPGSWLKRPFADFCHHLAALKQIELPPGTDWSRLEAAGWQRLAAVRNLELVRALFRRPLELWLFLDRVQFLQESGYRVDYGEFCAHALTPRNLLLFAEQSP